ncbi:MAG: hypothetical protein AABY22_03060 [Nanoarchaeota archaeon]
MITEQQKIIKRFEWLSDRYHKLSLLFYELSKSLTMESKKKSLKEFREYLKTLDLDINKIKELSQGISNLSLGNLKKNR